LLLRHGDAPACFCDDVFSRHVCELVPTWTGAGHEKCNTGLLKVSEAIVELLIANSSTAAPVQCDVPFFSKLFVLLD
jgi:hypothetical protein